MRTSAAVCAFAAAALWPVAHAQQAQPIAISVDTDPAHRLALIRPLDAIGAGIDSDPGGKIPMLYDSSRTKQMLEAGLGALSYRLYTELSIQDWHWNPAGTFSNAARGEGYWTSSARPQSAPIVNSYGYTLPHRGSTRDQGDDDGYSRIDDGDPATYWKSNPYLTSAYTHEPDAAHPQWALIDFGRPEAVDAVKVAWGDPFATRIRVEYWTGGDAVVAQDSGTWHAFEHGDVSNATDKAVVRRVSAAPVTAQFLRIMMTASSNTCDSHGAGDRRNCVGYAIRELGAGTVDAKGRFVDRIVHSTCGGPPAPAARCANRQTTIFVSSIDPWHGRSDRVSGDQDQPGLDFISRNAITRGRPVMYPVPLFYSTPQNAANEIRYLESRGYPISYIEMGEEVDGQYALPEDYAALYIQWARAIHAVDPNAKLGGPVFQGVTSDIKVWRNASGDGSWLHRFIAYLTSHGRLSDLAFMSYEKYLDAKGCDQGEALHQDLLADPGISRNLAAAWRADGVPAGVPLFITEANFSNDGGPVPHQLAGALWMADWIGTSLSYGVAGVNYYQYEAEPLGHSRKCDRWGGYGMFITDKNYAITAKAAQFYAARMLTHEWLVPGEAPHELFAAHTDEPSAAPEVGAYAAKRPDGLWSVLLVNKSALPREVSVRFGPAGASFSGSVDSVSFGPRTYHWTGTASDEIPAPNAGPETSSGKAQDRYTIAGQSIVVLRGTVSGGASAAPSPSAPR